jgi:hypothetical protein
MKKFGISNGIIRMDQGNKLARSDGFQTTMLKEFDYIVEPTGMDSPSQNGGAEIYNNTLAIKVLTLFYRSGLPAKFWSAALLHAVYLHNQLVHLATGKTPFKGWYNCKPDVAYLKTFWFPCMRHALWYRTVQIGLSRFHQNFSGVHHNGPEYCVP